MEKFRVLPRLGPSSYLVPSHFAEAFDGLSRRRTLPGRHRLIVSTQERVQDELLTSRCRSQDSVVPHVQE